MRKIEIDQSIIKLAIEELTQNGKKINVPSVAAITGYHSHLLYASGFLDNFITRKARKSSKLHKPSVETPVVNKEHLEQSVEAYVEAIQDGYFAHYELVESVQADMAMNFDVFQPTLFALAINRLMTSGMLTTNSLKPGYAISCVEISPSVPAINHEAIQYVLNDILTGQHYYFESQEEYERKISELSKFAVVNLKTFKAHEVIRVERIRRRVDGSAA